jgi:Ca2+/Na+ antiporter
LALANGAGDVITAIVAGDTPEGINYNVGSLFGAGLFVASVIVAITIKNVGSSVQLEATLFWRDIGFYVIATTGIIVFGLIGKLTYISAILMLLLYVALVLVVSLTDNKNDAQEKEFKTVLKNQILLFSDVKQPQSSRLKALT